MKSILTEGKHWPKDYAKTAYNAIKQSELGGRPWYSDGEISKDIGNFVHRFGSLARKNSNLGYFMGIIRMFIQYAKTKQLKDEFIRAKQGDEVNEVPDKLDNVIKWLQIFVNDLHLESKYRDKVKAGMPYEEFEKIMHPVETKNLIGAKNTKFDIEDRGYEIDRIDSYRQLNKKFGGNITGYGGGTTPWCHTRDRSIYEEWTSNGKYNFFVIYKKNYMDINPPTPGNNAYDEYGLSMMAILVNVLTGELLRCTLRWNHVIEPGMTIKGRTVDQAFIDYNEISKVAGFDVRKKVLQMIDGKSKALQKKAWSVKNKLPRILSNVEEIGENTVPEDLKKLLTAIVIPDNVKQIGKDAFSDCDELESVTIPISVTSIGEAAFCGCSKLANVTIPASVTSIGDYAFRECDKLANVAIPASVTSIGDWAFSYCSRLTSVLIPSSVTRIGHGAFYDCVGLMRVTIPEGVTSIGQWAFWGCNSLTGVTIPASVTSIGKNAFSGCAGLKSVTIPESLTTIPQNVFPKNCKIIRKSNESIDIQIFAKMYSKLFKD